LGPISRLVSMPILEHVVVNWFVIYQHVLFELRWIVVQKVAERLDDLGDGGGKAAIVFRQFLRGDK